MHDAENATLGRLSSASIKRPFVVQGRFSDVRGTLMLPRTIAMLLVLASLDYWDLISRGPSWRYIVVIGLFFVTALLDAARSAHNFTFAKTSCFLLFLFASWQLIITLDAVMSQEWEINTLVIVLGPSVALAIILGARIGSLFQRPGQDERHRASSFYPVVLGALFFSATAIVDSLLSVSGEPLPFFNHERTFVGIFVLSLPNVSIIRIAKLITIVALSLSFFKYFSATSLILMPLAIAVYWILIIRPSRRLLGVVGVMSVLLIFFSSDVEGRLTRLYGSVGRSNNSDTRVFLWEQALDRISESVLFGGLSRLSITGYAQVSGVLAEVPFHNSYLAILVVGGAVSCAFLLGCVIAIMAKGVHAPKGIDSQRAMLWLPAIVCALVAMAVNPVLDKLGVSLFFYGLLALGICSVADGKPAIRPMQAARRFP